MIFITIEEVCKTTSNVLLCQRRRRSKQQQQPYHHHQRLCEYQQQQQQQQQQQRRRQQYAQQYQILLLPVVVVNHIFIVLFVLYIQVQSNHAFTIHTTKTTTTTTTTTTTPTITNRKVSRQYPKFSSLLLFLSSSSGSQEMTTTTMKTNKESVPTTKTATTKKTSSSTKNNWKPNQNQQQQQQNNDETQQRQQVQQEQELLHFLNNDIIQSLDFDQIITIIAYYTTTKRGQQGLLSLVQLDDISLEQQQNSNNSQKQQKQQSIRNFLYNQNKKLSNQRSTSSSTNMNDELLSVQNNENYGTDENDNNNNIIDESLFIPSRQKFAVSYKIAFNQHDVNELYNCVEQAMLVYTSSSSSTSTNTNDNTIHIPPPPFLSTDSLPLQVPDSTLNKNNNNNDNSDSTTYKFTIPTMQEINHNSNNNNNLDDYDNFLQLRPKVWTFENIIHCEQMLQYILQFYNWSTNDNVQLFVPNLSYHIQNVISYQNYNTLLSLYDTIKDSIQIIRVRTIQDPTGSYTYKLQLNDTKYTILRLLRQQRIQIELLLNSKENKNKLQTLDKLRTELYDITIKIESKENEISKSIIKLIYNHIVLIDTCFNCLCELDILFAKAKFAIAFNGQIPKQQQQQTKTQTQQDHGNNGGQINVPNFIHPLLLVSQQQSQQKLVSNTVNDIVPIDLLLSVPKINNNPTSNKVEHALIISGSNGGGKTLALKSFGLVVLMTRLGIPIPVAQQSKKYTLIPQQQSQQQSNNNNNNNKIIVDYFDHVFASIGDQQNINNGESTYTSQLKKYSTIINIVNKNNNKEASRYRDDDDIIDDDDDNNQTYTTVKNGASILVLLDELGSGTESTIGSAIGQGVIESLLQNNDNDNNNCCRIVATTHSNSLKVLAFNNDSFNCASVLLKNTVVDSNNDDYNSEGDDDDDDENSDDDDDDDDVNNDYQDLSIQQKQLKKPEYKLHYGSIGDSYGLDAAIRCNPPFPSSMLQRVTELTSSTSTSSSSVLHPESGLKNDENADTSTSTNDDIDTSWQYQLALTRSIEQNAKEMNYAKEQAEIMAEQIQLLRLTMLQLATSYEEHFTLLEKRVDNCFQVLKKQSSNGGQGTSTTITKEVLGSTINEIRLVQKHIKSEKELLKEKGLKFLPNSYSLSEGEKVFIVASQLPSSIITALTTTTTTIDDDESSFVNIQNVDDDELCFAARVVSNHFLPLNERALLRPDDVVVSPESTITNGISSNTIPEGTRTLSDVIPTTTGKRIVVKRSSLAIWDYDSVWDVENSKVGIGITGGVNKLDDIGDVRSVKRKVNDVLAMLKAVETDKPKLGKKPATSSFTSSRGRRADKAKQSTTKKKKK